MISEQKQALSMTDPNCRKINREDIFRHSLKVFLPIILLTTCALFSEDPWGRDASLINENTPRAKPILAHPFQQAIVFHQTIISPADGPRSHFYPSSSEYGKKALLQQGTGMGLLLTCDRLMRENNAPWHYPVVELPSKVTLKYDPVPRLLE